MKNIETITPLPQSERFLIGSKAAVNLKYIQYISYEVTSRSFGEIFAVTTEDKVILDDCLCPDETIEKFRAYLKEIELMTTTLFVQKHN